MVLIVAIRSRYQKHVNEGLLRRVETKTPFFIFAKNETKRKFAHFSQNFVSQKFWRKFLFSRKIFVPGMFFANSFRFAKDFAKNLVFAISRVVDPDPDPDWIRIQWGVWIRIRIRNPDPDPGARKRRK
jgi:hypothetical protein